jgi:iron complex transport system ATP-binding protein
MEALMLEAVNVTLKVDGGKALLRHASLAVRPGELLALAGENGAGKSTLLKVLAGDLRPKEGHARLDGRPLYLWSLRELAKRRAVLPQEGAVAFGFTALEMVLLGRHPHCDGAPGAGDLAIARAALAMTDAAALEQRSVATLSGGERARVSLARVLAQLWETDSRAPGYLLLDEPVASLDLAHQHHALETARRFARERGAGVLAVLHDLNLASRYADRIAILKRGALAAEGTPHEVLTEARIADCFNVPVAILRHPGADRPLVVPPL